LRHPETNLLMYKSRVYSTKCPRCRMQNIERCPHDIFMRLYFDKERALMVKLVMQSKNNDTYQREIRNEEVEASLKPAFYPQTIDTLMLPRHEYCDSSVEHKEVYVVVDPGAGGKSSCYAIVSFITPVTRSINDTYTQKILVVC
jgi:hypothetical protein